MKAEAVQRVDDDRVTSHISGDLAQEARLGVVGVDDAEVLTSEDTVELPESL